jgi:serine phosphatase RsbU (regulator of sigma subunit)
LQRRLLPPSLPRLAGLDLAACYETAEADLDVGGDFYDAIVQPDGSLVLVIGDVCGRGAEAASITGLARHTLRTVLGDGATPGQALTRLNRAMIEDGTGDRFCTAVLVQVRETGGGAELTVASGGHPLPYVVRADGRVEEVGVPGQLLGVFPQIRLNETRVDLRDGEALLLYTDGVTEARDPANRFYPLSERAFHLTGRDPKTALKTLRKDLQHHTQGPLQDDAVMLLFRYHQPH